MSSSTNINVINKEITFVLQIYYIDNVYTVEVSEPNAHTHHTLFTTTNKRSAEVAFYSVYHMIRDQYFTAYAACFEEFKVSFRCNKDLIGKR